jgi:hypothetical protein
LAASDSAFTTNVNYNHSKTIDVKQALTTPYNKSGHPTGTLLVASESVFMINVNNTWCKNNFALHRRWK